MCFENVYTENNKTVFFFYQLYFIYSETHHSTHIENGTKQNYQCVCKLACAAYNYDGYQITAFDMYRNRLNEQFRWLHQLNETMHQNATWNFFFTKKSTQCRSYDLYI